MQVAYWGNFYLLAIPLEKTAQRDTHRRIKRQKGRQRSSLIFWLFNAARGGGRGYCETKFLEETHGNMMGFEPGTFR